MPKILRLGNKNKWICFVLLLTFRNFAIKMAKILCLANKNK